MNFDKNIAKVKKQVAEQRRAGRVRAFAASAVAALLMGTMAFAGGVGQGMWGRGGSSVSSSQIQALTGWTSNGTTTSTTSDVTIAKGGVASASILTLGNSATNHGGTLKIYANPAAINAVEFRNPADATLRGYIYPSSTVVAAVNGPSLFENAANKGTKTLAAGTGTQTVLTGSQCVCTDTTANASVKCVVSGTTLTFTGTGTDVIAYLCF